MPYHSPNYKKKPPILLSSCLWFLMLPSYSNSSQTCSKIHSLHFPWLSIKSSWISMFHYLYSKNFHLSSCGFQGNRLSLEILLSISTTLLLFPWYINSDISPILRDMFLSKTTQPNTNTPLGSPTKVSYHNALISYT